MLLDHAVDAAADEQEHEAVVHPHHRHHDRADIAVGAELVGDGDVQREHPGEHRPGHGAENRARPLAGGAVLPGGHPAVEQDERERQDREHQQIAHIFRQREQTLDKSALRQDRVEPAQRHAAVDHDDETEDDDQHKDQHIDAGADEKDDHVVAALDLVNGVETLHDRAHRARGGEDAEIAAINKQSDSHKWSLRPGYLSKQNGNVFFVKQRFELVDGAEGKVIGYNEHNNVHLVSRKFMDDGKLLADFARNILISGIKNSGAQNAGFVPLPPLETLILDGQNDKQLTADFNKMVENGDKFMRDAYKYALARIHKRMKEQNRARTPKNIDQIR